MKIYQNWVDFNFTYFNFTGIFFYQNSYLIDIFEYTWGPNVCTS